MVDHFLKAERGSNVFFCMNKGHNHTKYTSWLGRCHKRCKSLITDAKAKVCKFNYVDIFLKLGNVCWK